MKYYKLLTQDLKSHNNTQWQIGVPITIQKEGVKMCTDQVLHCYNHPLLAVLFNPIHAKIQNPKLFEISVDQIVNTDGLKFATKSQTLIEEISLPQINTEQRIEFAIKVAKLVCEDSKWNTWADSWLDGSDRSKESAWAAYTAAALAAYYAAYAAYDASYAAAGAAYAAGAAASADKNEFNQKMIDIIEEIVKVKS